jgi:hypothetical protein
MFCNKKDSKIIELLYFNAYKLIHQYNQRRSSRFYSLGAGFGGAFGCSLIIGGLILGVSIVAFFWLLLCFI